MSIKLNIKNEETGTAKAAIVVFSDHSTPYVLKPGEDVTIQAYSGRTISIVESEEDYSHGEGEDPSGILAGTFQTPGADETHSEIPLEFAPKEDEQS